MTTHGVDYSFSRPSPDGLKRAGYTFACRYLSGGSSTKDLTAAELASLLRAQLSVVLVWEASGGAAKGGRAKGIADATAANKQASALGIPARPIYFAVDYDPADAAALATAVAYIQGAASVLGVARTGVYGGLRVVNACASANACKWFWQTYAWSGGVFSPVAQLRQVKNGQTVAGGTVDLCEAVAADFGQFPSPAPAPKPAPVPGLPAKPAKPAPYRAPIGWTSKDTAAITTVQWCLRGAGYTSVRPTGTYDAPTRAALGAYQRGHAWAFLRDQPCGPGAVKARQYASLLTFYPKA